MRCNCGYKYKRIGKEKKQAKKMIKRAKRLNISNLTVNGYVICPMCHSRRYFE